MIIIAIKARAKQNTFFLVFVPPFCFQIPPFVNWVPTHATGPYQTVRTHLAKTFLISVNVWKATSTKQHSFARIIANMEETLVTKIQQCVWPHQE